MKYFLAKSIFVLLLIANVTSADTVLAARTIRSNTILNASDVMILKNDLPNAIQNISDIVGLETRVVLYESRPISVNDLGPAAIITRNQIVSLVYLHGNLSIAVEARSLGRAGVGEFVRVMNLSSRNTVSGVVAKNGNVQVGGAPNFASN